MIKTEIKKHLFVGAPVTIDFNGKEYIGVVVKLDIVNIPTGSSITIEDEDEKLVILPICDNMVISINKNSLGKEFKQNEDNKSDEEGYDVKDIPELKQMCNDRGLKYTKSVTKVGLINLLKYDDEHPDKEEDEDDKEEDSEKELPQWET